MVDVTKVSFFNIIFGTIYRYCYLSYEFILMTNIVRQNAWILCAVCSIHQYLHQYPHHLDHHIYDQHCQAKCLDYPKFVLSALLLIFSTVCTTYAIIEKKTR